MECKPTLVLKLKPFTYHRVALLCPYHATLTGEKKKKKEEEKKKSPLSQYGLLEKKKKKTSHS